MNNKDTIEIRIFYGRNRLGEEWLEYVCEDRMDAMTKLKFLKTRQILIPDFEDEMWRKLGLGLVEREALIKKIEEFKKYLDDDKPTYYIKYDYITKEINNEKALSEQEITCEVIAVSEKNTNNQYIHTLKVISQTDSMTQYFSKEIKVSLPKIAPVGTIDLKDFEIVNRPGGFIYKDSKGINRIKKDELWLFIKRAD